MCVSDGCVPWKLLLLVNVRFLLCFAGREGGKEGRRDELEYGSNP